MPPPPPGSDRIDAKCSFCGVDDRYEVPREQDGFDISSVGRNKTSFPPAVRRTLTCRNCNKPFYRVFLGRRRLIGFHGCDARFAERITTPGVNIEEWQHSARAWEWLGDGVYFWEQAILRAWEWADYICNRNGGGEPAVVGAVIDPATLIDLGDTEFDDKMRAAFDSVKASFDSQGKPLPANRNFASEPHDPDRKFRELDRLVVEEMVGVAERTGTPIEAVRAPFQEGNPMYPGAGFCARSHVQIAVRAPTCIRYVWREWRS